MPVVRKWRMNKLVIVAKAVFWKVDRETLPQQGTVNMDATIALAIHTCTTVIAHAFMPTVPADLIWPVACRSALGFEYTTQLTMVHL